MRTYRELFGIREFRVLFTTTSLNVAAGSVGSLALGTLTYEETGSPLLAAFVMFGGPLVRLATSWFLLSLADLWRPRTAMMVSAGLMAAGDAAQAIPDLPMTARLVLLVVPWVLLSATGGSMMALVSEMVPEGSFVFARATINIAVGVMQIVGYGLGGLLLLTFTTSQLFLGAAATCLVVLVLVRLGIADHPPRASGPAVRRSRAVNRLLLGSPVLRPVYLALSVPNGLVVGCEALFVVYAGEAGGVAAGRGGRRDDGRGPARRAHAHPRRTAPREHPPAVPAGRPVPALRDPAGFAGRRRRRRGRFARLRRHPGAAGAAVTLTPAGLRGQVLGLHSLGMMAMQGAGALLAGGVATLLGADARAAGLAIGVMATASVLVTLALVPGLRRSREGRSLEVHALTI